MLTGWFWFLGALLPLIGLVQYGNQMPADRYIYFPGIGLFILLVWGSADLCRSLSENKWFAFSCKSVSPSASPPPGRPDPYFSSDVCRLGIMRPILIYIVLFAILLAGFITRKQLAHWQSSRTLFAHTVSITSGNDIAHSNLAYALFHDGLFEEAADHCEEAIRIRLRHADHFYNHGVVLDRLGQSQKAMEQYKKAISVNPGRVKALFNLGRSLEILGRHSDADACYRAVVLEEPDHFYAHKQRGLIALYQQRYGEAIEHLQTALRIRPGEYASREGLSSASALNEPRRKGQD